MDDLPDKNERHVEAGRKGAEKRWGPKRVIRLDDLSPEQREFVLALIEVHRANNRAMDRKQDR